MLKGLFGEGATLLGSLGGLKATSASGILQKGHRLNSFYVQIQLMGGEGRYRCDYDIIGLRICT